MRALSVEFFVLTENFKSKYKPLVLKGGFMADHGFGRGAVYSKKTRDPKIITEIATGISTVRGVIWAHVVTPPERGEKPCNCHIIFEFGHPSKHGWNSLRELLDAIEEKGKVNEHEFKITDVCIIQCSYKG